MAQDLDPDRRQTWTMKSLDLMSRVQFQQNKFAEAEKNIRLCIKLRSEHFGDTDSWAMVCKLRLSEWLRAWNRVDEAIQLEAWKEKAF